MSRLLQGDTPSQVKSNRVESSRVKSTGAGACVYMYICMHAAPVGEFLALVYRPGGVQPDAGETSVAVHGDDGSGHQVGIAPENK